MDDGTQCRIGCDSCCKDQNTDQGRCVEICRSHTDHEAHEGSHREIKIIDRHDEHLRDCCECNWYCQIEQQVEAGIAHGTRLHVENSSQ
ncbi:hypothetical protein D3C80_703230 [compost metagenome]